MCTEIDDTTEIGDGDLALIATLQHILQLDCNQRTINDIPGRLKVYLLPGSRFWWAHRPWPNGSSHHLFGHGDRGVGDLTTEIELNVPLGKFSRTLGGAFLNSRDRGIILAHRGIVARRTGGRVPKGRFFSEMPANAAQLIAAKSKVGNLELLSIGAIQSPTLAQELELFADRARAAKLACA